MNFNLRKTVLLMSACAAVGFAYPAYASSEVAPQAIQQSKKVSGTVVDAEGPVIGATVLEKGTSNATVTDIDGNFSLNVQPGATLVISYVGYKTQEVVVGNQSVIRVDITEDADMLEEVVVVGYGVQKKKLVTGATVEVKGEDITKLNTTQVLGALQSQSPGVTIQAVSGQPGDGFKVAVRGAGTNSDTKPIYVIDGVAGGDINNLNPADIERIDVLKDAASAAIYGANGANGVILITTKQGKAGKVTVSYDGNIGWQNVAKVPQLLNARQFMQVQDMVNLNNGGSSYDWASFFNVAYDANGNPTGPTAVNEGLLDAYMSGKNAGTNWIDAIRNKNAVTTSHALNLAGGSDISKFSTGIGYQYQDGVFGKMAKSDFRRFTLRLNSEHVVLRSEDKGFDIIKLGENFYYQHRQNQGLQIGNQYSNELSNMLRANPLIPMYDGEGNLTAHDYLDQSGWFGFNSYMANPVYNMMNGQSANNKSKSFNMNAVGYIEIQPIKNLIYRGQVNYNYSSWSWRAYLPVFYSNDQGGKRDLDQVTQQTGNGWGWGMTHTLNYKFNLDKNNFDVLVGTEYGESRPTFGESLNATSTGSIFGNLKQAYVGLTEDRSSASVDGKPYGDERSLSYFGRINYDFNETYMLSLVLRADGSSRFAKGKRWGYFPSVSAGWVVTNEKFMESTSSWLDFLKIRAGWGQNGNKNIGDGFAYMTTFSYGDFGNYSFGSTKDNSTQGAYSTRLPNADLTWETSEQIDLGFDARFLGGRLGATFDWYNKTTKDLLLYVQIPASTGFAQQWRNAGTVKNSGIELALNWRDKIGSDFHYNVGWNMALNKNEVTKINGLVKYINGGNDLLAQNTGTMARMAEGHPIGYFYGYKTDGVMQNEADVQAYLAQNCGGDAANSLQGAGIKPGDLKFVDVNGDGIVNDDDKTDLGDPHPNITMGLTLGADYKGFDISITGYTALGQQVARSWRKFTDGQYENYTTEVYNYWHGEGTSNRYPLLAPGNSGPNWQQVSDLYVENAGYFRLQNLTVGYDFKNVWNNCPFQQLRLYFTAQNLFTITNYKGMDPENGMALNGSEPWVTGVDVGNYPLPRTYMVGVNIKF